METDLSLFEHTYIDNHQSRTLFTLHGTGGTMHDFLFLNDLVKDQYNLIGVQGNVREGGMPRFFKRLSFGVFDLENMRDEATKFQRFIRAWMTTHTVQEDHLAFLGYSNGANMLLAMLFTYPLLFRTLVLLHPMLPFTPDVERSSFSPQLRLFVSNGIYDQMIDADSRAKLLKTIEQLHVATDLHEYEGGHEISESEVADLVAFLRSS